ncbi:site-specific integrase [Amycolatopsis australiensis]|uniref:Site-specific recombinase XerD n=1 Tax=Amycolatopsis australiensis TaxID=546364 RepID=A0A1K1LKH0_9PSEU|nr:site-specific integrase [Amycolatopsis australiensis]SFW11379.1 Site-specific recombinase XerD [Amycolatopsis australiensis]SFW12037.1 Site-specific recombinase XerD [Amycolatopsis australiensis]
MSSAMSPSGPAEPEIAVRLRAAAADCDHAAGATAAGWVRERLAAAAAACRDLAAALGTDPTLATEPADSGRLRAVELVLELTRQLHTLLHPGPDGEVQDERRADADELAARLDALARGAARLVPRADARSETGAREISRRRLVGQAVALREAAQLLQTAAEAALAVEHPDPVAVSLAAMAVQIRAHAHDLTSWASRHPDPAAQLLAGARPVDEHGHAVDIDERPGDDAADGFAAAGTVLAAEPPGTGLAAPAEPEEQEGAPAWARPLVDETAAWLLTGYTRATSRTTAANALGIPRADQRLWRGEPTRNAPEAPNPLTFFPWCQRAGINPLTEMSREHLREWLAAQQAAGVPAGTRKTRLGYVSAFYREMRLRGKTTFEVPAALPRTERGRLGVLRPPVEKPTVALTLAQVRALRVAARTYRGRGPLATRELVALRHAAMVDLLTTTGIRADELCAANRGDLRRAGPDGHPALHIHGKGAKNRWVRITAVALDSLDAYLTARDAHEAGAELTVAGQVGAKPAATPLLATTSSARLGVEQIPRILKSLCTSLLRVAAASGSSTMRAHAAALRPIADTIHPHSARHFYARVAEAHGVHIRQLAADLGHSSVAVTEAYLAAADTLENSAAPVLADLITAGEELALQPAFTDRPDDAALRQPEPGSTEGLR